MAQLEGHVGFMHEGCYAAPQVHNSVGGSVRNVYLLINDGRDRPRQRSALANGLGKEAWEMRHTPPVADGVLFELAPKIKNSKGNRGQGPGEVKLCADDLNRATKITWLLR